MSSDPVAAKSSWLCTYMSNHPDTLVLYVSHFLRSRNVASASMESISSKDMAFTYTLKGNETKQHVIIPFDPPLLGYEEVKPRLLEMRVNAEDAMGMAKSPIITGYSIPWPSMIKGPPPLLLALIYITFAPVGSYGEAMRNFFGPIFVKGAWVIIALLHPPESIYMMTLCRKHKTGLIDSCLWTLSTLVVGYPFLLHYRGRVQKARIDSIMKGE